MEPTITMKANGNGAVAAAIRDGGEQLRQIVSAEVDRFDAYLRNFGHEYVEGLARFERLAVEGYIYQKLRGRL